ncbi:MAG: branched-chain amino acid ABC transporter permease [Promethearchaeota archaeon]
MAFVEFLIYGTVMGFILALISLGYSLVYGVGKIINLAHGAFYLLTAFIIYWLVDFEILSYHYAIIVGLITITGIGMLTYLVFIKPTQNNEIMVMIVTFAVAFLIDSSITVFEMSKGEDIKPAVLAPFIVGNISLFGVSIEFQNIIVIIAALLILIFTIIIIKKSRFGKALRAVSQNRDAARLMGINVNRILMFTVTLSALLAGIAAVLYVPIENVYMGEGWHYLLLSMSVVILGGMGSITGSVIGAFVISFSRWFVFYYIDPIFGSTFYGLIHLFVIVIVLVIRPHGILGKKEKI